MKLTELHPRWTVASPAATEAYLAAKPERAGMGVSFDCPVCRTHRLAVMFENPIDGLAAAPGRLLWHRTGDTFETLTLAPSINALREAPPLSPRLEFENCWHGFIRDGLITHS